MPPKRDPTPAAITTKLRSTAQDYVPARSGHTSHAVRRSHGVDVRWAEAVLGERRADGAGHGGDARLRKQGDGAPAESRAGHACAQGAGVDRRLDGEVELGTGHLEVVAERRVAPE